METLRDEMCRANWEARCVAAAGFSLFKSISKGSLAGQWFPDLRRDLSASR
jgi:hypothetical protein